MTITKTKTLHELLVRFNLDGTARGAHVAYLERVADGEEVYSEKELPAEPFDPAAVTALIGDHNAALLAQVSALSVALEKATQERDAAVGRVAAVEADIETIVSARDTQVANLNATVERVSRERDFAVEAARTPTP